VVLDKDKEYLLEGLWKKLRRVTNIQGEKE